jgi:hypothetical protein
MDENEKLVQEVTEERNSFGKPVEEAKAEDVKEEKSSTPETEASETKEIPEATEVTDDKQGEEGTERTTKLEEAAESDDTSSEEAEEAVVEPEEDTETSKDLIKKSGVQKRIDRLTAEKHQRDAEIAALKAKLESQEKEVKERVYSEEELLKAERKAIDDGDMALLSEVFKERQKNERRELLKMYQKEKDAQLQAVTQKNREWNSIVDRYANDDDPALDIRKQTSDLYRIAKSFYEDPELNKEYQGYGGMTRAVADAYLEVMRLRNKKKVPADAKKNERKSAKEKLKNSLSIPSGEKTPKAKESKSENPFDEYMKERELDRQKKMGT